LSFEQSLKERLKVQIQSVERDLMMATSENIKEGARIVKMLAGEIPKNPFEPLGVYAVLYSKGKYDILRKIIEDLP
jgi:hypothetical protein